MDSKAPIFALSFSSTLSFVVRTLILRGVGPIAITIAVRHPSRTRPLEALLVEVTWKNLSHKHYGYSCDNRTKLQCRHALTELNLLEVYYFLQTVALATRPLLEDAPAAAPAAAQARQQRGSP